MADGASVKGKLQVHKSRLGEVISMSGGPVVLQIPDGPLLVVEEMPWLQSASLGFFFPFGSCHEPEKLAGITHFIEHLIFKGTKTKTPRDIALAFEGVGGVLNASTGKEIMNVYGRIGSRYVQRGFNIIADMILNSRFAVSDIEKERGVILEEIRMNMDVPEQYLYEEFANQVWGKNPVARPIAGYEKTLKTIGKPELAEYFNNKFTGENTVISIAGNVDAKSVAQWWAAVSHNKSELVSVTKPIRNYQIEPIVPTWKSSVKVYRRDVEQATVVFGFPAPSIRSDDRYPVMIVEAVLSGGMGSRLFQQIREKSGLVYDIDLGYSPMRGAGVMTVDSATAPHLLMKLIEKVLVELKKLKTKKVGPTELARVKDYLEGGTFLGMESSSNRMFRNALGYLYLGNIVPTEEIIARLSKISADDVIESANNIFTSRKISCGVLVPRTWGTDDAIREQIESVINSVL